MTRRIRTVSDVFGALGGTPGLMRLTKSKRSTVAMWKHTGHLPPWTYLVIKGALERQGKDAPASLWGMPKLRASRAEQQASQV